MIPGGALIAGAWTGAADGWRAVDPRDGSALEPAFPESGDDDVARAAAAAAAAAEEVADRDPRWPAALLRRVARGLTDLGDELLARAGAECCLPPARLAGERARTCAQLELFAALVEDGGWVDACIDQADPARRPLPRPDLRRMLRPIGPVAVFGASNFPLAFGVCGGDAAAALAAGNPVIAKGHPAHPGVDALCADVVREAIAWLGLPAGLFALLPGRGHALGAALVRAPAVAAVAFTGSARAGRALADLAAARPRPIPVFAEMGSLNPLVVLPRALARRGPAIAEGLARSIAGGAGQFCTKPGVVLVPDIDHGRRFAETLARALAATDPQTMLGRAARDGWLAGVAAQAALPGVRALTRPSGPGFAQATPALLATDVPTWLAHPSLREEVFGPGAVVLAWRDAGELAAALGALDGQLTATLWLDEDEDPALVRTAHAHAQRIAGRVVVDGWPTGVEVCRAMVHGGPYPATTAAGTTSVGTLAIARFARPVCWQDAPDALLPPALRRANPQGIARTVDGVHVPAARAAAAS